jgi:hypothetical protein
MSQSFAKVIANLFHPIYAPLISIYLLFQLPIYINFKYTDGYFIYVYVLFFLNLILAPLLISIYLKRKNYIQSLEMEDVNERALPYLVSSIFYILTYFLLLNIEFPAFYLMVFQWATITVVLLFVLSLFKQKMSAHMAAWGGICGMLIAIAWVLKIDTTNLLIIFVLISGVVGFSRLKLNAHSASEIAGGFALGLALQLLSIFA